MEAVCSSKTLVIEELTTLCDILEHHGISTIYSLDADSIII
jgi:hypothetical protein